jgi:hypothetical protein
MTKRFKRGVFWVGLMGIGLFVFSLVFAPVSLLISRVNLVSCSFSEQQFQKAAEKKQAQFVPLVLFSSVRSFDQLTFFLRQKLPLLFVPAKAFQQELQVFDEIASVKASLPLNENGFFVSVFCRIPQGVLVSSDANLRVVDQDGFVFSRSQQDILSFLNQEFVVLTGISTDQKELIKQALRYSFFWHEYQNQHEFFLKSIGWSSSRGFELLICAVFNGTTMRTVVDLGAQSDLQSDLLRQKALFQVVKVFQFLREKAIIPKRLSLEGGKKVIVKM